MKPREWYDSLEVIAGTGLITEQGVNGWQDVFEGKPAVEAELSRPHFAMADADGNIFIADKDAHAIRKISPTGIIVTVAGLNEAGDDGDEPGPGVERHLSSPNGLFVRKDGAVFILDLGNEKVRKLSSDGVLTTVLSAPGEMTTGRGLWVSAQGDEIFFSSSTRVMRWTSEGGLEEFAADFENLGNLAKDSDGRLLITDRGAGRVWARDGDGRLVAIVNGDVVATEGALGSQSKLVGVRAVWPDDRGGLFLGTHESSRVWYLDRDGVLHEFLTQSEVDEVRGLSITEDGDLLIVDGDGGFVKRLRPRETSDSP